MTRPILFFSHSGRDQKQLTRLKQLFVEKTGGSIEVFLSSDGQSIPFGRNWVYSVQEALEGAKLMIVFVTPNSLRSSWMYFESGYVYSKNIRVVPVGFIGVDLSTLPPPLSLLQGFNITSEEGLNNLIALVNEAFDYTHAQKFTAEEYSEICESSGSPSSKMLGDYASLVDNIAVMLTERDGSLDTDANAAVNLKRIAELLDKEGIEHADDALSLHFYGVSIEATGDPAKGALAITMDPGIVDVTLPTVEKAIRAVRSAGINGVRIRFDFIPTVTVLKEKHKVTGHIYGSDVKMLAINQFVHQDVEFSIGSVVDSRRSLVLTTVSMALNCDEVPTQQMRETLELLFERGILYLGEETIYESFF